MSKSKDASSKLHEKHQTILADLLRDEDNKYCADCKAKGTSYIASYVSVLCIKGTLFMLCSDSVCCHLLPTTSFNFVTKLLYWQYRNEKKNRIPVLCV